MANDDQNPLEQIAEAVLYAPLGLVYEYKNVVPTLVRRGKSQVQIAKLMGQMAAKEGQRQVQNLGVDGLIVEAVETAVSSVAKGITDVGVKVGLAPENDFAPSDDEPPAVIEAEEVTPSKDDVEPPKVEKSTKSSSTSSTAKKPAAKKPAAKKQPAAKKKPAAKKSAAETASNEESLRLPIAGYDTLKAREVIPLLDDLSASQRSTIRAHESAGRNRKTILAKLDRLES